MSASSVICVAYYYSVLMTITTQRFLLRPSDSTLEAIGSD